MTRRREPKLLPLTDEQASDIADHVQERIDDVLGEAGRPFLLLVPSRTGVHIVAPPVDRETALAVLQVAVIGLEFYGASPLPKALQ